MLTNADITALIDWRHMLHRFPEVSGQERETAARVVAALAPLLPDQVITGLGGHGVAAVFCAAEPGPTVMFRAELDALPIEELSTALHRSCVPGTGHLCGHDGHMTILLGLARLISRRRPARGRVVLMFQPAEEDGSGAAAVIADPRYGDITPDWAFALHNMPGIALGRAVLAAGTICCASRGVRIVLTGKTAHAAQPEAGVSPAPTMAALMPALVALGAGGAMGDDYQLVTLTHVRLGEPAFGISPAHAEIWITLRTATDAKMAGLMCAAIALAQSHAAQAGLMFAYTKHDDFAATVNDPQATLHLENALDALALPFDAGDLPVRASEDFGRFGGHAGTRSAMVFLGSGVDIPKLHNPDYDYPDSLTPPAVRLFHKVMTNLLD